MSHVDEKIESGDQPAKKNRRKKNDKRDIFWKILR